MSLSLFSSLPSRSFLGSLLLGVLSGCFTPPQGPDPQEAKGRTITIERAYRWGHAEGEVPVVLRIQGIYKVEEAGIVKAGPAELPSYTIRVESEGGQWVKLLPGGEEVVEEGYSTRVGRTVKTTSLALADLLPFGKQVAVPKSDTARSAILAYDQGKTFTGEGFLVRCSGPEQSQRQTLAAPVCRGCDRMTPEPSENVTCRGR